jgi:hypothetical protein
MPGCPIVDACVRRHDGVKAARPLSHRLILSQFYPAAPFLYRIER